jgi:vancomycin permeability regulator SanA
LVLGYPSRSDGTLSGEQRDRVRTAVRVALDYACEPVVISGGAVRNEYSEAATMALRAVKLGLPRERLRLEEKATTTVENARFGAPKLGEPGTVFVVSNGLHAHRGVRDLCREAPALCAKARPAAFYYPFGRYFLKFPAAIHEGLAWLRG